jgi:threonylcarbamoyladenosine tRNA methylthiotransferase MtaB
MCFGLFPPSERIMDRSPKTFTLTSLGCKVNQIDGQAMRERLRALGYREVAAREPADVAIINTCTVTARADETCRKRIRRARRRHPEATVIVTGCGAVNQPERFRAMDAVDAVLTREQIVHIGRYLADGAAPEPGDAFGPLITEFAGHTRGFLKIQDGCDAHCAYCIVPKVRGRPRSRPLPEVAEQARLLVRSGHIELVLAGIHVGRYGADLPGDVRPADAVRAVLDVPGLRRLRLSSVEALEVDDALLDVAAADERFCPHFHLPLQSGDDAVLRRMGRPYTSAQFLEKVREIEARLDRPSITSDVMVGFPGETAAAFENTLAVCRAAGFSRIHIFPYSPRHGTRAAAMPGRLHPDTVRAREARLRALADDLALACKRRFLGTIVHPLVESRPTSRSGRLAGWTARYLRVELADGKKEQINRIVPARVRDVTPGTMTAETARATPE